MPTKTPTPRRKSPKQWIQGAVNPEKKGALHRDLGVPIGKKIPKSKVKAAARKPGVVGKRARMALTLSAMPKKGKKKGK